MFLVEDTSPKRYRLISAERPSAYMGLTYYDLGRYRETVESLNCAIRMKPRLMNDPYWRHMLGLTSRHAEQWEQSLAAFHYRVILA